MQKWASSTACKEQCEKHWRGDAHEVEAMGGEGANVTLARPRGTFHPRNRSRGLTSLPQPCPNTNPAEGWCLQGTRASEPPGHGCGSWMKFVPRKGRSANGPGCWKSPVLPAQRLCPMQGQHGHGGSQPALPSYAQPHGGVLEGTAMLCQGHWPRDRCTLSQDNEARVPPEQQRAQTDEKKEGRKEGGMLSS